MVKKHKKGFTIVELVVVIAVIAILAAVLIPTFVNLVHKAEFSNDQALVRNINTTLAISAEGTDGKPTMYDTLVDVQENGFVVENLTPRSSGSDIVWDEEHNQFVLVYENGTKYFTGTQWNKNLNTKKMWKIYTTMPTSSEYSIYLAGTNYDQAVAVSGVGFDAGRNTKIPSVKYTNTGAAQNVTIRTQGGKLIIDAENDTVKHYGEAQVVTLTAVGDNSYYEHGSVELVDLKKGRLVITNDADAEVGSIYLTATNNAYDGIILATMSGATLPEVVAREAVDLPAEGQKKLVAVVEQVNSNGVADATKTENIYLYAAQTAYEETKGYTGVSDLGTLVLEAPTGTGSFTIKVKDGNTEKEVTVNYADLDESVTEEKTATLQEATSAAVKFAGGKGIETNPYVISTAQHWNNFYQTVYDFNKEDKVAYFELSNDIDLTGFEINNYAFDGETRVNGYYMNFVLNGNNYSVIGVETLKGYCQIFPYLNNAVIKNITINYNLNETRTAAISYATQNDCYFTNVTITGQISTTANWATAFVAYSQHGNIYYTNCTNMANIKGGFGNNAYIAVFGSHNGGGVHITFNNCKNYGGLLGGYVGFVGMGNDSVYTFVDSNAVQNYGSMSGTKNAGYFRYDTSSSTKTIGGVTCEVKKGSSLATKSTTHTNTVPSNFNDAIVLNEVTDAVKYEVEMSFSIQVYNYDDGQNANRWSGGFPRSIKLTYTADDVVDGKITTAFRKGYVGEIKADNYYGYNNATPTYENGVFLPETFDIENANVVLNDGDVYLVEDNGNYYYVFYSSEYHGWYSLLVTNTSGEVTSTQVTVSFSVTAYNPDGSVLSFSSFSYDSPVNEAREFFNA